MESGNCTSSGSCLFMEEEEAEEEEEEEEEVENPSQKHLEIFPSFPSHRNLYTLLFTLILSHPRYPLYLPHLNQDACDTQGGFPIHTKGTRKDEWIDGWMVGWMDGGKERRKEGL